MRAPARGVAAAATALAAIAGPGTAAASGSHEAPAGAPLLYELPAVGSYELPPIRRVGSHRLLDSRGEPAPLLAPVPGRLTLVAFVYLSCTDAQGCPLALAALQRVDRIVAGRPDLAGRVDLATASFDPQRDGPEDMARLRGHMRPRGDWRFLTAPSVAALAPVLADYGQDAVPVLSAEGRHTGLLRHVTKVFLVDDARAVRNVYSSGFLEPRLLVRDLETLLAERSAAASTSQQPEPQGP